MHRSDDVRIEECVRCGGTGRVVGTSRWETPMSAWVCSVEEMESEPFLRLFKPHNCDACNGAGTVMFTDAPRVKRGRYADFLHEPTPDA